MVGQYGVGLAEIKRAQSGAEVARRSVERAQNLVELGAVARAELERRSAEQANAQSTIETQRAELARIEEKLHRFGMTDDEIQEMNRSGDSYAVQDGNATKPQPVALQKQHYLEALAI